MTTTANEAAGEPVTQVKIRLDWSHQACEVCWFKRPGNMVEDWDKGEVSFRIPVQAVMEDPIGRCCFCGSPCITKIYVREDPESPDLECRGQHHDEDEGDENGDD